MKRSTLLTDLSGKGRFRKFYFAHCVYLSQSFKLKNCDCLHIISRSVEIASQHVSIIVSLEERFRTRLLEMERENVELRQRVTQFESSVSSRDAEVGKLKRRLQNLEIENETLKKTTSMYEQERRSLEREVQKHLTGLHFWLSVPIR